MNLPNLVIDRWKGNVRDAMHRYREYRSSTLLQMAGTRLKILRAHGFTAWQLVRQADRERALTRGGVHIRSEHLWLAAATLLNVRGKAVDYVRAKLQEPEYIENASFCASSGDPLSPLCARLLQEVEPLTLKGVMDAVEHQENGTVRRILSTMEYENNPITYRFISCSA